MPSRSTRTLGIPLMRSAEVTTRDSILLTYFDDTGVLRLLRNRGKRLGNWALNELRYIGGR